MASSLLLTMGKVLYQSGPVSMFIANMLIGSVSVALLVFHIYSEVIESSYHLEK